MAFSSLWSDVTDTNRVCDWIIIFPTILGPISRPGVLKIAENRADSLLFWVSDSRRQPNCSGRVAHVALLQRRLAQERNSLTTEWLSDWFKVTAAWHDGQSRRDRVTVREPENERKGWMKKKTTTAVKEIVFLAPLFHGRSLTSSSCCQFYFLMLCLPQLQLFHSLLSDIKWDSISGLMDLPGCTYSLVQWSFWGWWERLWASISFSASLSFSSRA